MNTHAAPPDFPPYRTHDNRLIVAALMAQGPAGGNAKEAVALADALLTELERTATAETEGVT